MKKAAMAARVGNRILSIMAGILILLMLSYGMYSLWDTYKIYANSFADEELLKFRPTDDGEDNPTLKDLKKYYAANTPRKWYGDVERQKGQSLRASEHVELGFKHTVKGKNYYAVYAWGDYDGIYSELDLRGH